jgi:divalent metal cation (Fe/Co/Zn/Cd) transporter
MLEGMRNGGDADRHYVRQARVAQIVTVTWMSIELLVAVAAGITAGSVALVAFGADSGIELFSALIVLRRVLRRDDGPDAAGAAERDRRAARLVGWALVALAAYVSVSSAWCLLGGGRPEAPLMGAALSVAALVIMPPLWLWRLRLAKQLGSAALRGDAACSLVCIYMAAVLLGGLLLNRFFGWWWADPVAGLAMVYWIGGEAREALVAGHDD